jgi:hypothetical protein
MMRIWARSGQLSMFRALERKQRIWKNTFIGHTFGRWSSRASNQSPSWVRMVLLRLLKCPLRWKLAVPCWLVVWFFDGFFVEEWLLLNWPDRTRSGHPHVPAVPSGYSGLQTWTGLHLQKPATYVAISIRQLPWGLVWSRIKYIWGAISKKIELPISDVSPSLRSPWEDGASNERLESRKVWHRASNLLDSFPRKRGGDSTGNHHHLILYPTGDDDYGTAEW